MKCNVCNFENKEDALYCASCGAKLTGPDPADMQTVRIAEVPQAADDSEDDEEVGKTDVLAQTTPVTPRPAAPAGTSGVLPGNSGVLPGNSGVMPGGGFRPPMGGPVPPAPMPGKAKKSGSGVLVWAIIASVLLVGCVVVGVIGYLSLSGKVKDEEDAKAKAQSEYEALKTDYDLLEKNMQESEASNTSAQAEASSAKKEVVALEERLSGVEEEFQSYKDAYDPLINFANTNEGRGSSKIFVSASVLHLEKDVDLRVYVPEEAEVSASSDNAGVAGCEVKKSKTGLYTLSVKKGSAGTAVISVKNDESGEIAKIFVYVD